MTAGLMVRATADATTQTVDTAQRTVDRTPARTAEVYTARITPWQSHQPRFVATVRANVQPYADLQGVIASLPAAFDLDYAVGSFLDGVGARVGLARTVPVPLPNTFFSLDSEKLGLDLGYWQSPLDSGQGLSLLPDTLYRRLMRARILSNRWDGSLDGITEILRAYITNPATRLIVEDAAPAVAPPLFFTLDDPKRGLDEAAWYEAEPRIATSLNMQIVVGLSGTIPSQIDLAVLDAGLIAFRATGTEATTLVTTVDRAPLFGLDVDNAFVGGLDHGAWGASPGDVAAQRVG